MSLALAMLASTALASSSNAPAICAGCTLEAPAEGQAMPLLVVLRAERSGRANRVELATEDRAWRAPALSEGWAVLTLAGWEAGEPSWIEEQVFAAARQHSIDLSRVYLAGSGDGATYIAHHVRALSETFAAVVITGGGAAPAGCPDPDMPAYFRVDAGDIAARTMRLALERCKQPVVWSAARGGLDRATATAVLTWLHRHVRVTTLAM